MNKITEMYGFRVGQVVRNLVEEPRINEKGEKVFFYGELAVIDAIDPDNDDLIFLLRTKNGVFCNAVDEIEPVELNDLLRKVADLDQQIYALQQQRDELVRAAKEMWRTSADRLEDRHPAFVRRTVVGYTTKDVLKRVLALGLPYTRLELDRAAFNKAVLENEITDESLLNEVEVTYEVAFAPKWVEKLR